MKDTKNNNDLRQHNYYYFYNLYNGNTLFTTTNGLSLHQFADLYCRPNYHLSQHKQDCDELTVIYDGEGKIYVDGVGKKVKKGQIHLCFKNNSHYIESNPSKPLKFFCVGYSIEKNLPLYEFFYAYKKKALTEAKYVYDALFNFSDICKNALTELYFYNNSNISKMYLGNILEELVFLIYKTVFNLKNNYKYELSNNQAIIYNIKIFLEDNIFNPLALQQLPERLSYSYSHISHLFSKSLNLNLKAYFFQMRMTKAEQLLKEGKTVTQVSNIMGYSSIHAFSKAYTSFFNKNPKNIYKE